MVSVMSKILALTSAIADTLTDDELRVHVGRGMGASVAIDRDYGCASATILQACENGAIAWDCLMVRQYCKPGMVAIPLPLYPY